jgi:hypothetical protein
LWIGRFRRRQHRRDIAAGRAQRVGRIAAPAEALRKAEHPIAENLFPQGRPSEVTGALDAPAEQFVA